MESSSENQFLIEENYQYGVKNNSLNYTRSVLDLSTCPQTATKTLGGFGWNEDFTQLQKL